MKNRMIIEMLINGGGQLADERRDLIEIKIAKKKVSRGSLFINDVL